MTQTIMIHISWLLIDLLIALALYRVYTAYKNAKKEEIGELVDHRLGFYYLRRTHNHVDKVIKKIMICLENDQLDRAQELVRKINKISPHDTDVILLTTIIEQSKTMHTEEYYETLSYQ